MAFTHGKNATFSIDDSGGTVRDISAFVTNVDFSRDADVPETTVFGNSDRTFIAGLRGSTFSISGHWDNTATTGPDDILNGILGAAASVSFDYSPDGTINYTGQCFETSYSVTAPVDGVVDFSADFTITGAVSRA